MAFLFCALCIVLVASLVVALGMYSKAIAEVNYRISCEDDLRHRVCQLREDNSCLEVEAEQRKETIRLTTIAMLERSKEVQRLNAKLSAITATINSDEVNK